MPRLASGGAKSRLTLELPSRVRDGLERLRSETDAESLTEVIRRSLAVYGALVAAREDGARIIVRRGDGSERELLIL